MKKRDIPFLTYDVLGDDCYSVLYRDIDKPKVELSIKAFKDIRNLETEMTADRFAEKYAGHGVHSISGITLTELLRREKQFTVCSTSNRRWLSVQDSLFGPEQDG